MKKVLSVIAVMLLLASALFASPVAETAAEEKTLTLYAYDTFCGDWGSEGAVIPAFEAKTGIKVNVVDCGSTLEMITKLTLEGDKTEADVILGVTDDLANKVYDNLEAYQTPYLSTIDPELVFDPSNKLIPFDWGLFSFVWDSESGIVPPTSLNDMMKDEYKDKVILIDPRSSSVGTGLMMWTYNALGDGWENWWKTMTKNALATTSGWSAAYGLFTEGEAPIVLSYTTSPVYHVMNENTTRYQTLVFEEGHEATIEGIGIVKGTKHRAEAEAFIDFILTDAQLDMAVTNSMYPVNSTIELPEAYAYAPAPEKMFHGDDDTAAAVLERWVEVVTK